MGVHIGKVTPAADTGDFDSDAAGTVKGGTSLAMTSVAPGTLSCLFTVEAETDGITMTLGWQVSDDDSTWYNIVPLNNVAFTVAATGTAGDDPAISKVIACPAEAWGWNYARPTVTSAVQTGAATDTYSMGVRYRDLRGPVTA